MSTVLQLESKLGSRWKVPAPRKFFASILERYVTSRPAENLHQPTSDNVAPVRVSERPVKRRAHDQIPSHVWPGLLLLLQAHEYAVDVDRDRWEFAVELAELRRAGLTKADCRWLICKGWAELARELRARTGGDRQFRLETGLIISTRACIVLSSNGVQVAREQLRRRSEQSQSEQHSLKSALVARVAPCWDRERHELRVGGMLVKQFKLPSPNQEMILTAFEEEHWPPRIDDPLPPSKKFDAKQRLHDTIKNLNRNQKHRLIRFMGDGTGQGVRWEFEVEAAAAAIADSLPRQPK